MTMLYSSAKQELQQMKKGKQKKEKTKTAAVVGSMSLSELQEMCRTLKLEKEVTFHYTIRGSICSVLHHKGLK